MSNNSKSNNYPSNILKIKEQSVFVRGRPLDIQGGLGVSGEEKLFISCLSGTKIFFFTFSVMQYIPGLWVQIFLPTFFKRN